MRKQRRRSASRQLRGNREADQRLCFRYIALKIPLLSKSEISTLYQSYMAVCEIVGNQNVGFLMTRLIFVVDVRETQTHTSYHSRVTSSSSYSRTFSILPAKTASICSVMLCSVATLTPPRAANKGVKRLEDTQV